MARLESTGGPRKAWEATLIANRLAAMGVVCVLALAAISPALAAKQDIYGFKPGMTFEAAKALAAERQYAKTSECNMNPELIDYGVPCAGAALWFSNVLPGKPLVMVFTDIKATMEALEIAASVSQQFGVTLQPSRRANGFIEHYEADLGDGIQLRLDAAGRSLKMMSMPIWQQAND